MPYNPEYKRVTLVKEFPAMGDNDGVPFFVEFKNPHMLPYGEKINGYLEAGMDGDTPASERADRMAKYVQTLIVKWNMLDMATGEPVAFTDPDAPKRVPSEVFEAISAALAPSKKDAAIKNS